MPPLERRVSPQLRELYDAAAEFTDGLICGESREWADGNPLPCGECVACRLVNAVQHVREAME